VARALAGKFQKSRRIFSRRTEAIKRAAISKSESGPRVIFQSDNGEGGSKTSPSPEEIRQRAFEIYIERGGIYGYDLDDWLQAEGELQGKCNKSNDEAPENAKNEPGKGGHVAVH
jgi:hypothetical protein